MWTGLLLLAVAPSGIASDVLAENTGQTRFDFRPGMKLTGVRGWKGKLPLVRSSLVFKEDNCVKVEWAIETEGLKLRQIDTFNYRLDPDTGMPILLNGRHTYDGQRPRLVGRRLLLTIPQDEIWHSIHTPLGDLTIEFELTR